jgi:ubiquinone/menaquinone biosynthesis C-methylase UbiE
MDLPAGDRLSMVMAERERIRTEYERRAVEVGVEIYAPWQDSSSLILDARYRLAAKNLYHLGVFPEKGDQCLDVGFGAVGWFSKMIDWGVSECDLHGIELDQHRAHKARELLPAADLRVGDATELPWDDNAFQMVVASTVFTSILDARVRRLIANEITRVLAPGGALLWYDFAVNNPRNPHVRKVDRRELKELFPRLNGAVKSITLAPPLARFVAPRSWVLATILEAIPFLRTHLIAVLIKR